MRVAILEVDGRTYIDCIDLMNAIESWKLGMGKEGTAVLNAMYKTIDKTVKDHE